MYSKKKKTSVLNKDHKGKYLHNIYIQSNNEKDFIKNLLNYFLNENKLTKKRSNILRKNTIQGKSGGLIFKTKYNTIIKTYKTSNIKLKHINNKCFSIDAKYNEIILNTLLSNYENFIKVNQTESDLLDKHILKINQSFINKNNIYIETPFCQYIDTNNKSYTTCEDILFKNFKVINTLFLKKEDKIISTFDKYLTNNIIKPIINTLKILKKKLKFIHSDIKFQNIFINQDNNPTLKIKELQKYDLHLDFIPLLADFDKSSVYYNNINIIPDVSNIKLDLLKITKRYIIEDTRHKCQNQNNIGINICKRYNNYEIDYLIIFINLYLIIYTKLNKNFIKVSNNLINLKKYTQKCLKLNESEFQLFLKILKNNYDISNKRIKVSKHISLIIYYLCKKLDRLDRLDKLGKK